MTEFLTENGRRSYPLDGDWPSGMRDRMVGVLLDACVYAKALAADGERMSVISVQRNASANKLVFKVGTQSGPKLDVAVAGGLGERAVVYAYSADVKAFLVVDGKAADSVIYDASYTTGLTTVNIPFASRCCGAGKQMVTSVTAQGAMQCERPMYSASDPHRVVKTVSSGAHMTLKAWDGVDIEVTRMAPLQGDIMRISAIAATELADLDEEPIDIMIRGDGCFSVAAAPDEPEDGVRKKGTIRITNACKPCCQCEDYADAVNMLKPAETVTWDVNSSLDGTAALYKEALETFNAAKEAAEAAINSVDNVRASATAVASQQTYKDADSEGTRQRVSVTVLIENMTMRTATVSVTQISLGTGMGDYSIMTDLTMWNKAGDPNDCGIQALPTGINLKPGETLSVYAVYSATGTNSIAAKPTDGTVSYTVKFGTDPAANRSVAIK